MDRSTPIRLTLSPSPASSAGTTLTSCTSATSGKRKTVEIDDKSRDNKDDKKNYDYFSKTDNYLMFQIFDFTGKKFLDSLDPVVSAHAKPFLALPFALYHDLRTVSRRTKTIVDNYTNYRVNKKSTIPRLIFRLCRTVGEESRLSSVMPILAEFNQSLEALDKLQLPSMPSGLRSMSDLTPTEQVASLSDNIFWLSIAHHPDFLPMLTGEKNDTKKTTAYASISNSLDQISCQLRSTLLSPKTSGFGSKIFDSSIAILKSKPGTSSMWTPVSRDAWKKCLERMLTLLDRAAIHAVNADAHIADLESKHSAGSLSDIFMANEDVIAPAINVMIGLLEHCRDCSDMCRTLNTAGNLLKGSGSPVPEKTKTLISAIHDLSNALLMQRQYLMSCLRRFISIGILPLPAATREFHVSLTRRIDDTHVETGLETELLTYSRGAQTDLNQYQRAFDRGPSGQAWLKSKLSVKLLREGYESMEEAPTLESYVNDRIIPTNAVARRALLALFLIQDDILEMQIIRDGMQFITPKPLTIRGDGDTNARLRSKANLSTAVVPFDRISIAYRHPVVEVGPGSTANTRLVRRVTVCTLDLPNAEIQFNDDASKSLSKFPGCREVTASGTGAPTLVEIPASLLVRCSPLSPLQVLDATAIRAASAEFNGWMIDGRIFRARLKPDTKTTDCARIHVYVKPGEADAVMQSLGNGNPGEEICVVRGNRDQVSEFDIDLPTGVFARPVKLP